MEENVKKDRTTKIIAVVALLIAVASISIGFAAFSETLNINSSGTVTPEDSFSVYFSDQENALLSSAGVTIQGVATNNASGTARITGTQITDISATFKENASTVTYNFYVANDSAYIAYLKSITFDTEATTPVCTGGTDTARMDAACANMSISISVGNVTNVTATNAAITTNNSIAAKNGATVTTVPVQVVLTYAAGAENLDEEVSIDFGTITLGYSTSNS